MHRAPKRNETNASACTKIVLPPSVRIQQEEFADPWTFCGQGDCGRWLCWLHSSSLDLQLDFYWQRQGREAWRGQRETRVMSCQELWKPMVSSSQLGRSFSPKTAGGDPTSPLDALRLGIAEGEIDDGHHTEEENHVAVTQYNVALSG